MYTCTCVHWLWLCLLLVHVCMHTCISSDGVTKVATIVSSQHTHTCTLLLIAGFVHILYMYGTCTVFSAYILCGYTHYNMCIHVHVAHHLSPTSLPPHPPLFPSPLIPSLLPLSTPPPPPLLLLPPPPPPPPPPPLSTPPPPLLPPTPTPPHPCRQCQRILRCSVRSLVCTV